MEPTYLKLPLVVASLYFVLAVVQERLGDATTNPDADFGVRLSRAIYMYRAYALTRLYLHAYITLLASS
jgi:hypothetical protein